VNPFRNLFRRGSSVGERLVRLEQMHRDVLFLLLHYEKRTMSAITDLQAVVTKEDNVIQAAIALINGFATQLAAAGTDPVALQALQDDIATHTQALANAVAANTPVAPPAPAPSPAPAPTPAPAPAPVDSGTATTDPVDPSSPAAT
jgi:hypothetical protein